MTHGALQASAIASREALNAHSTTPHFKMLDKNAKPLVGQDLSIAVLRAFDEAGVGSG
jgi:hypothetical protein